MFLRILLRSITDDPTIMAANLVLRSAYTRHIVAPPPTTIRQNVYPMHIYLPIILLLIATNMICAIYVSATVVMLCIGHIVM